MTNILYADWFILSKLFLKHVQSPLLLREYDVGYHNTTENKACPGSRIECRLTWLSVWTRANYLYHIELHSIIYFFSIALYCIESHCVESNRNWITLHHNRAESYRITLVAASYVWLIYHIVGYALRCVLHRARLEPTIQVELGKMGRVSKVCCNCYSKL